MPSNHKLARSLRRQQTPAEEFVWMMLRDRRFKRFRFRRQAPIGAYVVDFVCHERKLIVELDGSEHEEPAQRAHDERRDNWLRRQGFRVLRIENALAREQWWERVAGMILEALEQGSLTSPLTPGPSPAEGRGET
jgi:very-short-patch-repair endonuclease